MKKIFYVAITLLIASTSIAWENDYNNNYNNQDEKSFYDEHEKQELESEAERNKEYPYESNTGIRYKYDLSNPSDRIMYEVDPSAQVSDSINPMVEIDRNLGQYGGGAE